MTLVITEDKSHEHCFHVYRGPIWMVIPDGHTVQKCCKCLTTRLVHVDHLNEWRRSIQRADYSSYFAPMGQYVKRGLY